MKALPFLLLPLAAMAAEPALELEPVDRDPAWRFSIGLRAAPGIKTSAAVDARAAAAAAGGALRAGRGGGSSSGAGTSVSVKTEDLGSTTEGTTEQQARDAVAYSPDRTRYDFDNGYIDLDDGADPPVPGETQNWRFESADNFVDGAIRARTPFESVTTSRTRTTRTETSGQASTSRSASLHEDWGELHGSSDETAAGLELRLDRTVWENEDFGVDVGVGYAWYDDVDCFSVRGRAYSAVATERTTTTTAPSGSRTTTTETTTTTRESGTVVTSIAQEDDFSDPADYVNADGSIGGAVEDVNDVSFGRTDPMPVLTVTQNNFSTSVERNPTKTSSASTTATSGSGAVGGTTSKTSSRTARRTVDVRSEGTLSLQELRLGVRPFWKATRWLSVRADAGLLATYSEIETTTRLSVDGAPASAIRRNDDDWTLGGYAGLSLAAAATDRLEFSVGAEARFPHKSIRFDDGVVSGKADLAEWSAFAAVGWRF
jgi:hypothetical protein